MTGPVPLCKYNGLPAQRSHLCPSYIKDIGQLRDILKRHITGAAHQPVAQARAVQKQQNPIGTAEIGERRQFLLCIYGTVFRRIGNIDHAGKYHMFMVLVRIVILQILFQHCRFDLSVFMRHL